MRRPLVLLLVVCLHTTVDSTWRSSRYVTWPESQSEPLSYKASTPMEELVRRVLSYQAKKDVEFIPFLEWGRSKGIFQSVVKLNFHGNLPMAEFRRLVSIVDNNMFATAWIASQLLEVGQYEGAPVPSDEDVLLAVEALRGFHDQNVPHKTSVMNFWSQVYNQSTQHYESFPENLVEAFKMVDEAPLELLEKLLDLIGLKEIAQEIKDLVSDGQTLLQAFHIPPDFDDTFVNVGLGSLIYKFKGKVPSSWNAWSNDNTNISSAFSALKKYQYRPFSSDRNANTIDPRTYMWVKPFLDLAQMSNKDVALVTTWIQNIDEDRTLFYKGVAMPFNVNNVDATVSANTIYGITSAILSGLTTANVLDDPDILQVYHNTSALLAHELTYNMTNRPDLALTYYPSRVEFYWFVARTFSLLDTARAKGPLPRPVMEAVYQMLKTSLESGMSDYVLRQAQAGEGGTFYYDDFLGDGDLSHDNETLVRGEDRIFTTAMAANALLYTWTAYNDTTRTSHWRPGAGRQLQQTILGVMGWLDDRVHRRDLKPWNAFFSGSVKGFGSLPFWYPGNRFEFLNRTVIQNATHVPDGNDFIYGVQGYIDPADYAHELTQPHFGVPTPLVFDGYNSGGGYFPLWSSEPYTYSTVLVAMARYNSIRG